MGAYNDKRCTAAGPDGRTCRAPAKWWLSDYLTYYFACEDHFEQMAKSGLTFRRCSDLDGTTGEHGPVPFNL